MGVQNRGTDRARQGPDQWGEEISAWCRMHGVTHLCVDTMGNGPDDAADQHIHVLRRLRKAAAIGHQ